MGEVVYWVELDDGPHRARCGSPRRHCATGRCSPTSFRGDVLTDFSFIEHSFGLTPAGADR